MKNTLGRSAVAAAAVIALLAPVSPAWADLGTPAAGADQFTMTVFDDYAGGERQIDFVKAYAGSTPEGTPIYVYGPQGWQGGAAGVVGLDPSIDPDPADEYLPCATPGSEDVALNTLTPATVQLLGDEIASHIVAINETHYGPIGSEFQGTAVDPSLVVLIYNVYDESYYNCQAESRTAGYFAPNLLVDYGMNTIVLDSLDFEQMTGDPANATDLTSEGVIAHELEHLLHGYSDSGETSWVDEGLADFAMFINGYPVGGSHVVYQQVFHRETSLTRWGGGMENYGASYTFMQYLWDQAGGNGASAGELQFAPDFVYSGVAGDLAIKTVFAEEADGMIGVQNAIDSYNEAVASGVEGDPLPDATTLFQNWAVAVQLDDEASALFDISSIDLGSTDDSWGWTIDIANQQYWDDRGLYQGAMPAAKYANKKNVPAGVALPFGVSYEYFRNVGPRFQFTLDAEAMTGIADATGDGLHWYGGSASMTDALLDVRAGGDLSGATLAFQTWYYIEDGWDFGYVEALVDGEWTPVPVTSNGMTITTDDDPYGNNSEGDGLTGVSAGSYGTDQPTYIAASAVLPVGTTAARFRHSTDAAYVDTGWFIDAPTLNGAPVELNSPDGSWRYTDGMQHNDFALQVVSACDLTPGTTLDNEIVDPAGYWVYRYNGTEITTDTFTRCTNKASTAVIVSNMPSGDLDGLDAGYLLGTTIPNKGNGNR